MYLATILLRERSNHHWSAWSRDEAVSGLLFTAQGYLENESIRVLILNWRRQDCAARVGYRNAERGTPCYVRVVATSGMPAGVLAQAVDLGCAQPVLQRQLPPPIWGREVTYHRI